MAKTDTDKMFLSIKKKTESGKNFHLIFSAICNRRAETNIALAATFNYVYETLPSLPFPSRFGPIFRTRQGKREPKENILSTEIKATGEKQAAIGEGFLSVLFQTRRISLTKRRNFTSSC